MTAAATRKGAEMIVTTPTVGKTIVMKAIVVKLTAAMRNVVAPPPTLQYQSSLKHWKLTDIGFFDPDANCERGKQTTTVGNHIHYRDVHQFLDSVADHADTAIRQQHIAKHMSQLLRDQAAEWWINQLSAEDRLAVPIVSGLC